MECARRQFSELLESLAESLDISEIHYKQAQKRYLALSTWLGREESVVTTSNPEIYPQGSFRLGTVIKPLSDREEYDIDLVCEVSLAKDQVSQKELKELVGREVKGYAKANSMKSPPAEGRRCWTLHYEDGAQFHMDTLPAIPDGDSFRRLLESKGFMNDWSEEAIAITDNTLPNYGLLDNDWPRSNPKGYSEWFKTRMDIQFDVRRKSLAESLKANIETVPEYKIKTPLQRAIQILKRHRDIMFDGEQENKPISIIVTTLAAQAYNNEVNLLDALVNIVNRMPDYIETKSSVSWVPNPVNPLENFADKWQEHPRREQNFIRWIKQVQADLNTALRAGNIKAIGESLKPHLGEMTTNEALKQLTQTNVHRSGSVVRGVSRSPSRFNVLHRQPSKWPITLRGWVNITARAYRDGFRPKMVHYDSDPLSKHFSLRFEATTSIPKPYKVYWQVVNTGYEAQAANCLRGEFYTGVPEKGGCVRKESTLYTGMHWVECFIIKDGVCMARSGEFIVNIK